MCSRIVKKAAVHIVAIESRNDIGCMRGKQSTLYRI